MAIQQLQVKKADSQKNVKFSWYAKLNRPLLCLRSLLNTFENFSKSSAHDGITS